MSILWTYAALQTAFLRPTIFSADPGELAACACFALVLLICSRRDRGVYKHKGDPETHHERPGPRDHYQEDHKVIRSAPTCRELLNRWCT